MIVEVPRLVAPEAPFLEKAGRYAPMPPQVVGALDATEADAFSAPFSAIDIPDAYIDESTGTVVYEAHATPSEEGGHVYEIPDELAQFGPVLFQAAAFEHSRFLRFAPKVVALTMRRRHLEVNEAQSGRNNELHRDNEFGTRNRFYLIADREPTEFFDQLYDSTTSSICPVGTHKPSLVPEPYQIVGASASAFHRSPHTREAGVRTFMRIAFAYTPLIGGGR
jgi:hypothetical protein